MAVFISVTTDPFEEVFAEAQQRQPQINVRRPLRGLQIKKDTYAVLRVLTATGVEIPLFDSSSPDDEDGIGQGTQYSNFIVQQVQETRMEKQQIVETFGEDYIFFFGERPRFLDIRGILVNTTDFNWKSEFWTNYENYLRGTRLVEQNARVYLYFDDVVVEGYIVTASTTQQAMMPYHLPFNFQFFVCNYAILSTVGSVFYQQDQEAALANQEGLVAPDEESQKKLADKAARQGSSGGLSSFLASTSQFLQDASFSIQNTLENIRNTFYARQLVIPEGIGNQLVVPPIENKASFQSADVNVPIYYQGDEYVERSPDRPQYDEAERKRVEEELKLRDPEALEKKARQELQKLGIDVSRRESDYLLLGRAAFAGAQTFGSFGVRQADGELDLL